jgi:hypothetical protein
VEDDMTLQTTVVLLDRSSCGQELHLPAQLLASHIDYSVLHGATRWRGDAHYATNGALARNKS